MKNINTNFFSYEGTIDRKNYAINMLIIAGIFFCLNITNFSFFFSFTKLTFLYSIFSFVLDLFKLILMLSAISIVYRRLSDIVMYKSREIKENTKKLFTILFVIPLIIYFIAGIIFPNGAFLALIYKILLFVFMPIAFIFSIAIGFVQQKK